MKPNFKLPLRLEAKIHIFDSSFEQIPETGIQITYEDGTFHPKDAKYIVNCVNNMKRTKQLLKIIKKDAEMALNGDWDKCDEGFHSQLIAINSLLKDL